MNLGEIFRASGLHQPERTIKWQEAAVVKIAADLLSVPLADVAGRKPILAVAWAKMKAQGVSEAHALWTLRDAEDRYVIRKLRASLSARYEEAVSS
jgi:hypothetical protein